MAELRIGDSERESAVAALGEHYAQGRLTKDEFDERSDAAWTARTAADLRPLFADLPVSTAGAVAPAGTGSGSGAPATAPPRRRQVPWKALLIALAVLGIVTNGKLVLLALLLWFVLSRHHAAPRPPWTQRGPGAAPPPPWGHESWGPPPPWGRDHGAGGHRR